MAKLGRVASFATSYDLAFLHAVLAALEGGPAEPRPCTALPFRKVAVRQLSGRGERWLAAVNVMLLAAKCEDDIADEGGWKGKLGLGVLSSRLRWAREVMAESAFAAEAIAGLPNQQAVAEELEAMTSLEALALPTSVMLGEVFGHLAILSQRPEMRVPLRHLGQGLGAAIYIKDALDDLDRDSQRGRFNAIAACSITPVYARKALHRELSRAQAGLLGLGLGQEEGPLVTILESLAPTPLPAQGATQRLVSRRRRQHARGVCEWWHCFAVPLGLGCDPCTCAVLSCNGDTNDLCGTEKRKAAKESNPPTPREPESLAVPWLLCPACGEDMRTVKADRVEVDECGACFGLWLDHGELEQLAALGTPPERLLRLKTLDPAVQLRPEGTRPCPRCAQHLTVMTVKGTRLDVCSECSGLFLDRGELNALLKTS